MGMQRTQFMFPKALLDWLRKEAKSKGISMGEMLRRILDERRETGKSKEAEC